MIMLAAACGPRQPTEQEAEQLPTPETEQPTVPVLRTGNLLGLHTVYYELAPGVTTDQLIDFGKNKYFPEAEKHFPGLKGYVIKGRTGECVDCLGHLIFFESTGIRDQYWKADGGFTDPGMEARGKVSFWDESYELAKWSTSSTDWLIQ